MVVKSFHFHKSCSLRHRLTELGEEQTGSTVFAIPVASSKSERVFSVTGNVVTPKRASLAPEKVESFMIVKTNGSVLRDMG